jgi:hypothetical protein
VSRRYLSAVSVMAVASGVIASLMFVPAAAQAPAPPTAPAKAAAKPWTVPRTPDGKPDLQGNWSNATLTPLERPANQGAVLTQAQADAIENRTQIVREFRDKASDPNRPTPPVGGEDRPLPPGEPTFLEQVSAAAGGKVGGYNNFWLDPGDHVMLVDGLPRSSIVVDPPDGRVPALTPEARQRAAERGAATRKFGQFDHPELRGLAERCLMSFGSNAGPPMLPNYFYNNNYTIVQTRDHVTIMTEMVHDARIIRLTGGDPATGSGSGRAPSRPEHPPKSVRQWMGDSIGRWEGDTLVVETTNFHPLQVFRGASENLKVIERFARTGPDTILYKFTIDDPSTFVSPWSGQVPFNRMNDLIYEYACHEGNYALANVLSGERDKERRDAEKKKQQ